MRKISIQKQRQILDLAYEGESIRSIAKKTKVNWRTARKYKHQFNQEIEKAAKDIEAKIRNKLDQLDKGGLSRMIGKIMHL